MMAFLATPRMLSAPLHLSVLAPVLLSEADYPHLHFVEEDATRLQGALRVQGWAMFLMMACSEGREQALGVPVCGVCNLFHGLHCRA